MRMVSVPSGQHASVPTQLEDAWRQTPGGHKWLHYFPFYQETIGPRCTRPLKLLEIGVYKGASLQMWSSYLPQGSQIVGIDIDPSTALFDAPTQQRHVRVGDQSDAGFLARVVEEFGPFDVIIDDGSHIASHMIASFRALFIGGLVNGGLYLVEDTHTNYWAMPYRDQKYSFVDFCKDLVDLQHFHYLNHDGLCHFTKGDPQRLREMHLPRLCTYVEELRFRDSLVAIYKRAEAAHLPVVEHL